MLHIMHNFFTKRPAARMVRGAPGSEHLPGESTSESREAKGAERIVRASALALTACFAAAASVPSTAVAGSFVDKTLFMTDLNSQYPTPATPRVEVNFDSLPTSSVNTQTTPYTGKKGQPLPLPITNVADQVVANAYTGSLTNPNIPDTGLYVLAPNNATDKWIKTRALTEQVTFTPPSGQVKISAFGGNFFLTGGTGNPIPAATVGQLVLTITVSNLVNPVVINTFLPNAATAFAGYIADPGAFITSVLVTSSRRNSFVTFDDIILSYNRQSVVPTPEPSSILLIGLGSALLMARFKPKAGHLRAC